MKKIILALTVALATLMLFASCGEGETKSKGTVKLIYVNWSSEIASANVVKAVLQEKMGYTVEAQPVDVGVMWEGIGSGSADVTVAAWLPTTHAHYLEPVKNSVEDLGPNLEGTKLGLVVPKYVTIDSIEELNANADKFKGKIIGIDPGAGLMKMTRKVVEDYELTDMKLITSRDAVMTVALKDAIEKEEWVVVTSWTPHWMFAKWELKYLEDPKGIYGGAEYINTIVRKDLKKDMPEVYAFLDNFKWTPDDMAKVMVWNQEEGADPYETAKRWVEENEDKVNSWLK